MNQGKYVFAQAIEFLSHNDFLRCVSKYQGNYKVKTFTCWHQLLYMIFGQLSNRDSLSDLVLCLQSQANKTYHLGMGKGTSKANLAKANEKRDYRIYEAFALELVAQIQLLDLSQTKFTLSVEAPVYAIDATVVDLCLNIFWWGKFRKRKAAVKMHTMMDVKTNIPTFIYVTSGAVHELTVLEQFPLEVGSFYVMDKGYIDFSRLHDIHATGAFFITRAKANFTFRRLGSRSVDKDMGLRCDQSVRLKNRKVLLSYPEAIRRIKYFDAETQKEFVFMTNNFEISALEVAQLYKYRWTIELFFKWIKQHLKVKSFWGYSFNAVKTQIYIAMITYLLVALIKHQLKLKQSQYEILQILSVSLLCKTPLPELFSNQNPQSIKELNHTQLSIFTL
ncbi:MAG: IS4 family transposase [Chitinophagaceae bacterium]|nr:MAG: IS4 family transposase [Chitinophagaceae bacterium]